MAEQWTILPDGRIEVEEIPGAVNNFRAIVSSQGDYDLAVASLGGFDNQEIILIEELGE